MDQLLQMIQSADPTDNQSDSVELLQLEGKLNLGLKWRKWMRQITVKYTEANLVWFVFLKVDYCWPQLYFSSGACNQMGPLIDQKLEDIDRYIVLTWRVLPTENFWWKP